MTDPVLVTILQILASAEITRKTDIRCRNDMYIRTITGSPILSIFLNLYAFGVINSSNFYSRAETISILLTLQS